MSGSMNRGFYPAYKLANERAIFMDADRVLEIPGSETKITSQLGLDCFQPGRHEA